MYALLEQAEVAPWVLHMPKGMDLTEDQFFEFCVLNRELLRIERTAGGEILIMSPTGARGSHQNLQITMQLALWAERDGTGVAFDSNGGFNVAEQCDALTGRCLGGSISAGIVHGRGKRKVSASLSRFRGGTTVPV